MSKKYLLDTHIWLWQLLEPERLSPRVQQILDSQDAELFLSPISTWETMMLAKRKRICLLPNPKAWIDKALMTSPVTTAPLTHRIAVESAQLPDLEHKDPADRLLIATARVEKMCLLSADGVIKEYPHVESIS